MLQRALSVAFGRLLASVTHLGRRPVAIFSVRIMLSFSSDYDLDVFVTAAVCELRLVPISSVVGDLLHRSNRLTGALINPSQNDCTGAPASREESERALLSASLVGGSGRATLRDILHVLPYYRNCRNRRKPAGLSGANQNDADVVAERSQLTSSTEAPTLYGLLGMLGDADVHLLALALRWPSPAGTSRKLRGARGRVPDAGEKGSQAMLCRMCRSGRSLRGPSGPLGSGAGGGASESNMNESAVSSVCGAGSSADLGGRNAPQTPESTDATAGAVGSERDHANGTMMSPIGAHIKSVVAGTASSPAGDSIVSFVEKIRTRTASMRQRTGTLSSPSEKGLEGGHGMLSALSSSGQSPASSLARFSLGEEGPRVHQCGACVRRQKRASRRIINQRALSSKFAEAGAVPREMEWMSSVDLVHGAIGIHATCLSQIPGRATVRHCGLLTLPYIREDSRATSDRLSFARECFRDALVMLQCECACSGGNAIVNLRTSTFSIVQQAKTSYVTIALYGDCVYTVPVM